LFNELRRICGDIDLNCSGLGIRDFHNPVSITQGEFDYITQFIQSNDLKSGFECATAFGVSACAAGLGFQKTGGHLITMDCYIEEITKNCAAYNIDTARSTSNTDPVGLRICKQLLAGLNLNCVTPLIGVSPDDIPVGQYDYVFIDAEHTDVAVRRDLLGIKPFLAEKFAVFVHDWHCFHDLASFVRDNFGCEVQVNVANSPYNLSMFRNF
jgi:hypothetical protein